MYAPKGPRATEHPVVELPEYARDMPDWWVPRDTQLDATEKLVAGYEAGARVMFLDAPTGTGKTAMSDLVRRRLEVKRGLYVCTTKALQEQVARDFPYARVLKGRRNYWPVGYEPDEGARGGVLDISCADCNRGPRDAPLDEQSCSFCPVVEDCPYLIARSEAAKARVGILNTAFLLTHLNGGGAKHSPFVDRELVVADECDLLEDELLGYVEVKIGKRWVERLGLEVPKKGSHMTTIRAWLAEDVLEGLKDLRTKLAANKTVEGRREYTRADNLVRDVRRVVDREEGWVRDGDDEERDGGGLVLKPVSVEDVGGKLLWDHGERWLCMSGTVVSAETLAESLGLEEAGIEWDVVRLDMPFAKENRRVVYVPAGLMTRKGQEAGGLDKVLDATEKLVARHPGVNVLVHTFSYYLAKQVAEHLRDGKVSDKTVDGRPVITYIDSRGKDAALRKFRAAGGKGGAVMVAASMDRGIDLPDDDCRVQIVCKMPMASLGSRQVSERLRTPGGDSWYLANTCRTLMQMCGRGVRSERDSCVTYVVDSHFGQVLREGKKAGMFPAWWMDALELGKVT